MRPARYECRVHCAQAMLAERDSMLAERDAALKSADARCFHLTKELDAVKVPARCQQVSTTWLIACC